VALGAACGEESSMREETFLEKIWVTFAFLLALFVPVALWWVL
jgi:hypothetical protein